MRNLEVVKGLRYGICSRCHQQVGWYVDTRNKCLRICAHRLPSNRPCPLSTEKVGDTFQGLLPLNDHQELDDPYITGVTNPDNM